jgi:DNA-binding FadR family transcriptional regulator
MTRDDAAQAAKGMAHAHASLVSAIVSGQSAAAQLRAETHLKAVQDFLRPRSRGRQPRDTTALLRDTSDRHEKLAEVIARNVRADIAQRRLPVGSVIGSEDDLRERYGVSRAVLREAVRLLEYHSVATMRRGPGGGLVVGRPDPAASIEAAALYLQYRRAKVTDLQPVREALELGVLDLLTGRSQDEAITRWLEDQLTESGPTELDAVIVRINDFHLGLAQLVGNPVIALLLRIALSLWDRYGEPSEQSLPASRQELSAIALAAHRGIVAAVLDGDYALARHRMSRHLSGITAVMEF